MGTVTHQTLCNIHHAVVIGVRLIQLKQRKFRIVARINALVAENAADFIYLIKAADNQPLEVQLQRNAHIHIDIKRVVMRDKRAGRRASGNRMQHRRFHLDVAFCF